MILGNFLTYEKVGEQSSLCMFKVDERWKGGSLSFAHAMRDEDDKVVTAELSLRILQDATLYQMDLEVFLEPDLLSEILEEP